MKFILYLLAIFFLIASFSSFIHKEATKDVFFLILGILSFISARLIDSKEN